MKPLPGPGLYGLVAEYGTPQALIAAARASREAGYRRVDAYTPFPIEELNDALDIHHSRLPLVVLGGGVFGALAGFGLQWWASVIAYPLNVGGRPLNSWPAFIPPTFEMTILFASLAAVFGMLALNGLPMPYHPVFNAPRFALASRDRYFLAIEARDPRFDRVATADFLREVGAVEVSEVED